MTEGARKETARRSGLSIRMIAYSGIAWAAIVAAVLIWQAYIYQGMFALIAEWQFRNFDRMFPVATIFLLVFLLALPFILTVVWRLRRRRRRFGEPDVGALLLRDELLANLLKYSMVFFAVLALVVAVIGLSVRPLADRSPQRISFANDAAVSDGRIAGSGQLLTDRIGYYRERFVVTGRDLHVAPLVNGPTSRDLRYFVEVPQGSTDEASRQQVSGILRIRALPGGLRQLYENAGYDVRQPVYMIFASSRSASWPYFSAAADFGLLALLLGLSWLIIQIGRAHV